MNVQISPAAYSKLNDHDALPPCLHIVSRQSTTRHASTPTHERHGIIHLLDIDRPTDPVSSEVKAAVVSPRNLTMSTVTSPTLVFP